MANRRLIQASCDSQQKREIETLRSEQFRLAAQQELVWDSTKISTHQEFVEIAGKSFSFFNIFSLFKNDFSKQLKHSKIFGTFWGI